MAPLISVKLSRFDGSPWGFRLQGGKDFGTPLVVQKVHSGSPAEAAGLRAGDAVIRVNSTDTYNLRHKDAQDVIVRAGNNFEITVQRGVGGTWKPNVTPVSSTVPSPVPTASAGNITPVTKTSLAAKKQDGPLIGSGHNFSPKPFLNGTGDGSIKSIVNKQYNSPVGIYSEETIAETLSAQAEVLAGGVLGVNFKKNEKNYNAENSEVFKMVQEADKEPKTPEPVPSRTEFYSAVSHAVGGRATSPRSPTPLYHALGGSRPASNNHYKYPTKRQDLLRQDSSASSSSVSSSAVVCSNCDQLIVGVFVRIKEKNLHVECFKCSTCGTSLKNVGYYNINNKLYCDIHAKLVARQNAPSGLMPVTMPPGGKAPASTISAALANVGAPLSPPLSNHGSSPLPFSACNGISPDHGYHHPRRSYMNRMNGCTRNGEYHEESKTFTSTITIQTDGGTEPTSRLGTSPVDPPSLRSVQAPTSNSLIGPKPFGAPSALSTSIPSTPTSLNSVSSTLPRLQSQTVTDTYEESSTYYEFIEEPSPKPPTPNPNSVKSRSLAWPPPKPIEDITYPTASPLYINPNQALDQRPRQSVREKRASIEACEKVLRRRSERESTDREIERYSREACYRQREDPMDRISCPGPSYRRVELVDTASRQSRGEAVNTSRPSSTDSVRRSLTPTRIVQPIPKPWTATVTTGSNLYEQAYGPQEVPKVCKKITQREVCHRERISQKGGHTQEFKEESRAYRSEVCRREQTICPKPPLPIPPPAKEETEKEMVKEVDTEVTDLRDGTSDEEAAGGVGGEHDLITETSEEDVGNMHVKKTQTFEKTVEVTPRARTPTPEPEEEVEQCIFRRSRIKEVETSGGATKTVEESKEYVTSAIDAQKMLEQAKEDEEARKKEEEEEERRKEQEERRKKEEEERRRREEEEKRRREQEEEEERQKKRVTFEEQEMDEIVEEVREQPLGRTYVKEERVTGNVKETYEEITEEVLVQERVRKRDVNDDERRKSIRDQVEVHQSLRDQQPERRSQEQRLTKCGPPPQETMETHKKHVQFVKETELGPKPITSTVKNATAKEWKSEMVNALTTAPDRPFTPLSGTATVKEVYTEETIYLDHRMRPIQPPPKEEIRPISPFQQALMIAPERPYTPLSREIGSDDHEIGRSQTPLPQDGGEYCAPADILYRECRFQEQVCTKQTAPRPLPTPPPDFRLRDSSPPAACRSRPQTPSDKPYSVGLKKPDTIPLYQRNLIHMRKEAVDSQQYVPSRTPTPTPHRCKSPASGPPERPSYYTKAQAPKVREDAPPCKRSSVHFPTRKSVNYHVEEDTPYGPKKQDYKASKTVCFNEKQMDDSFGGPTDGVHAEYQERRYMTSEDTNEEQNKLCHTKRSLQVVEDFERCERRTPIEPPRTEEPKSICAIGKVSKTPPSLPCPMSKGPAKSVPQATYTSSTEVRHVRYNTPSPCPETGVTILPCKAHSDQGVKAGVVVVPCEGPQPICPRSGICVKPTTDRSGVCVSPCFGMQTGACGQPSGSCGQGSGFDVTNCPESGICVAPCADGSVCVAPCKKSNPCSKALQGTSSRAKLPFPQIPLPNESSPSCDRAQCPQRQDSFQPIRHQPRTNLSGQLARLTAKNRDVPTVQLYKSLAQPQSQSQPKPQTQCHTESHYQSYCKTQSYCQTPGGQCQSQCQTQCQSQNHCQDGIHCPPSDTQSLVDPPNLSSHPDLGTGVGGLGGPGSKSGSFAGSSAPKRGRGILNQAGGAGSRVPLCGHCSSYVRGPFITALGQIWCPDHFVCVNTQCRRQLQDIGFVEEKGQLYCEYCFERFIAPPCNKCNNKIRGDCLNAIGKHFHPECFNCSYCGKLFGNSPFFLEEGLPYCEADWNELFTTKCFACGFPVEAGDRWVEALNNNYHSQCFNCTMCKKNLDGQSFYAKGGRPFCKNHAR